MRRMTLTSLTVAFTVVSLLVALAWAQQAAPPSWKQGQPAEHGRLDAGAHRPAAGAQGARRDSRRQDQGAARASRRRCGRTGINNARAMTWGDKGTLFVSSRVAGNVYAVVDKGGQREVKVIAKGLNLPNGVAFKDGTLYIAEVSRITKMAGHRGQARQPARHGSGLRHPAARSAARLEVPGLRARRQALLQYRRALQHLHPAGHPRQYLAREPRRHRLRVRGPRRPQQRGLRLASGDQGALLRHPRPRLARRGRAERPVRCRAEEGPALRLPLLPSGRHPRSRVRQGTLVLGVRAAADQDRPARGRQRRRVLHRLDVPARVQEPRLPRPARLLEPDARRSASG